MELQGSFVAVVTPFANGEVDYEALDRLVEYHIENGTDGIVPCGTTGESPTLSHEEHEQVIERVIKQANGRVPVIAGTGSNNTAEAVRLTRFAEKAGADAALLISPYYNKPEPEGMFRHFKAIADSADIPQVLYNVPGRTGRTITIETVERLAEIPNIVAIKEASLSIEFATEIARNTDMTILSGEDSFTYPLMAVGAKGVISVVANIAPKLMKKLTASYLAGDYEEARKMHLYLYPLCKAVFIETNPIPVKAGMAMMGLIGDEIRLPLSPLSKGKEPTLQKVLEEYELL